MNKIIGNLKLARKFLLIGVIVAVTLAVPSALILEVDWGKLRFAQSELGGIAPARDALKLLQLTQQHRGLSAGYLSGNTTVAAARQSRQDDVDRATASARASLATLGDAPLTALAERSATEWQALARGVADKSVTGAQSFERHTALIGLQLTMIEDISHASGLVLHPEAPGYFLQNGVLIHLPRLTEALGQVRARGALLLTRGSATPEERSQVGAQLTIARMHAQDARKSLNLALKDSSALRETVAAPLADALAAVDEGLKLVDERLVRAETLSHPSADYFAATTRVIDEQFKLIDVAFTGLDHLLQSDAKAARNQLGVVLGSLLLLGGLALWTVLAITRTTTASIGAALHLAESVAAGNLGVRAPSTGNDEVAQLLRALGSMNQSLSSVVRNVRDNAEGVATASSQIASGNMDLSQRTEEQASALEQTAASMEQIGATVRQNAEHAQQANHLALGASEVASKGGHIVGQVVDTMKGINESSRRITDIIAVIDSIAFQTNILALNAAVEAARAGEQGRGFAVVASEVRSLAHRSAGAAKEIKSLITASVERVDLGTSLVDQARVTMHEIVEAIQRVTTIVGEISNASSEQSSGLAQVGEAVNQMDQVTQQNAALVEESAAAAESLKQQASRLVGAVAVFQLAPDTHHAAEAPTKGL